MRRRLFVLPFLYAVCLFIDPLAPTVVAQVETKLVFDTFLFVENDVEIKSRLSGVIEEILVDRGTEVQKGTPLARLDNRDLKLEMERSKTVMQEAEIAFERAKSLFEQELLSASDYDQKRLAYDRAKAESDLAQVNYEKSILVAPFTGVVVERYAHLGQRVVEDDNAPLFRITAMAPLLARIHVAEEQLGRLTAGMRAEFIATLSKTQSVPARIKWISSVIDPASGLAPVILVLQNSRGLKPGTSGKITIAVK